MLLAGMMLPFSQNYAVADDEILDVSSLSGLPEKGHPKLDSALSELADRYDTQSSGNATDQPLLPNAQSESEMVRVIIESREGQAGSVENIVAGYGTVEGSYGDMVQALVPAVSLTSLAENEQVHLVRQPMQPLPFVISEGVPLVNADDWQSAGYDGTGVKVGILDVGFGGYASLLGSDLPAGVSSWWSPSIGGPGSNVHGTACAEIVYDMAPGAAFYLANFDTVVEMGDAVDWLIAQDVDVISCSVGFPAYGSGDGTGPVCSIIDTAHAAGITWVQSAGNSAQMHWQGVFSDTDQDHFHNFSSLDESNAIYAYQNDPIVIAIRWDDPWGGSSNNLDIFLLDQNGNLLIRTTFPQDGDDFPYEQFKYTAPTEGIYHVLIGKENPATSCDMHLYSYYHSFQYQTASGSICIPGDSGNAITVGSVGYTTPDTIRLYSSRGPTDDGRTKPDIVAPDGVSTVSYGASAFPGTSAAAPHIAGAVVLVKQRFPSYTSYQVQTFLEDRAIDIDPGGKDNTFGSGRLDLVDTQLVLKLEVDGNGTTIPSPGRHSYDPGSTVNISAVADTNWQFFNWTGDVADPSAENTTVTVDADKTVIANFLRTHSTLTVAVSGNGTVTPPAGDHTYPVNTDVPLSAIPEDGWTFTKWTGDVDEVEDIYSPSTTITMNEDYSIQAGFNRWLPGWDNRIEITIDAGKVDADLTHFPVLLHLGRDSGLTDANITDIFEEIGDNRGKIAVTTEDGESQLYVEVENWDAAGEEAWLWVSSENWTISSSINTYLYFYYDNDQPDNTAYVGDPGSATAQNVWDSDYMLVDHMKDHPSSANFTLDSTSYGNDGIKSAGEGPTENATGFIGNAMWFDGIDDFINENIDGISDTYTVEFIVYKTGTNGGIFGSTESQYSPIITIDFHGTGNTNNICGYHLQSWLFGDILFSNNDWTYLASVFEGRYKGIYIDSEFDVEMTEPTYENTWDGNGHRFGGSYGPPYYEGLMDEARISRTARSEAWIKATYASCWDELLTFSQAGMKYDLTVSSTPGGHVTTPGEGTYVDYPFNTTADIVAVPDSGWRFAQWSGDIDTITDVGSANTTIIMTDDISITAVFDQPMLIISVNGNGTVIPASGNCTFEVGSNVNITATPGSGWQFSNWAGDTDTIADTGSANTTITMDDDYAITAVFNEIPLPPAGGGGMVGGSIGGGGGGGGTDDKRFTNISASATSDGTLWEDVIALSVDIQAVLIIPEGTIVLNANGYPAFTITVATLAEPDPANPGTTGIGEVYDFSPDATSFSPAATLTLHYDPAMIPPGVNEAQLYIGLWDEDSQSWVRLDGEVDTANHNISTLVSHFSCYTILADTAPADFSVGDVSVPQEIHQGDTVSVVVTVANSGNLEGTYTASLELNGETIDNRDITLAGGESRDITFNLVAGEPGSYTLGIDGARARFDVLAESGAVAAGTEYFIVDSLDVEPTEVNPGEEVTISASIANTSETEGSVEITLNLNGTILETRNITIAAGQRNEVIFTATSDVTGKNLVQIHGQLGSFTVVSLGEVAQAEPIPQPHDTTGDTGSLIGTSTPMWVVYSDSNWPLIAGIVGGGVFIAMILLGVVAWRRKSAAG